MEAGDPTMVEAVDTSAEPQCLSRAPLFGSHGLDDVLAYKPGSYMVMQ